jgi:tetratricopeptide (TPR) repeat protein
VPKIERALTLARAANFPAMEADILRELGLSYCNVRGDYAAARTYLEEALRIYRETGDRMGEGRTLNALGVAAAEQGDYDRSRSYSEQGRRLCCETGNHMEEVWGIAGLGRAFLLQGDYTQAQADLKQALHAFRQMDHVYGQMFALWYLAFRDIQLGDYDRARDRSEQHLRLAQESLGWVYSSYTLISLLFHQLGDDEVAHDRAQQALLIALNDGNPAHRGDCLTLLGQALVGLGQLPEATDAYRQALDLRRELGQSHLVPEPLTGLARVALARGEMAQALAHVEEILSYLEAHPTLDGAYEPLRIYLTCHQILRAVEDPRAEEILDAAYRLLQERATKIDDEDLRRSYLENVAAHREIVATWKAQYPPSAQ